MKFTFAETAETVAILGLNNDWETSVELTKKKDGTFACEVTLPKESKHEFKYLVNGTEWLNEPEADAVTTNVYGGTNSVVEL